MNDEPLPHDRTAVPRPARVFAYERLDVRDTSIDWLSSRGVEIRFGSAQRQAGFRRYSEELFIEEAQGCDALLGSSSALIGRRVIEALPDLAFICKFGIGVDSIDVGAATEHGILVTNTPDEAGVVAVAEHAIALILALRKRLTVWTPASMKAGGWRGSEYAGMVRGMTVGIIGFGRIGHAVASRLAGWNVTILAYDVRHVESDDKADDGVVRVALDELLRRADVVTLHCGATPQNGHLIDHAALARMKESALLINTGRGSLVDPVALVQALRSGRLAGAGLDVYEQEPPDPQNELFTLPNVVTTPHVAAWTLDVVLDRRARAARNLHALLRGEACADVVNPEARPRARPRAFPVDPA